MKIKITKAEMVWLRETAFRPNTYLDLFFELDKVDLEWLCNMVYKLPLTYPIVEKIMKIRKKYLEKEVKNNDS